MEKGKRLASLIICLVLTGLMFSSSMAFAKDPLPPAKPYNIQILTFRVGSSTYVMGVALADLINKNSTWLRATAIETPGVEINAKILALEPEKRKNTLVWTSQTTIWMLEDLAIQGVTFPYRTLKPVSLWGLSGNSFVTLDPKLRTVRDLNGKKVALAPKGIWGMSTLHAIMFDKLGIKANFTYMGLDAAVSALQDGLVDAAVAGVIMEKPGKFAPTPALQGLIATKSPYFVSYDEGEATAVFKKWGAPMVTSLIPAKQMGPTQVEPWVVAGLGLLWGADVEMPSEVVYEICRVIYENAGKFADYHITGAAITKETMALVETTDRSKVHPGALKFYDEKRLKIGFLK